MPHSVNYHQSTDSETVIAIHFIHYSGHKNTVLEKLTLDNHIAAKDLITSMYNTWNEKKPGYKYKCTAMLYQLLYDIRQQINDNLFHSTNTTSRISIALDYIHKHYKSEQISIAELAKMCAVSETYLQRQFREIYSISPVKYINNLRLEYAAQLLQSRLYTVEEVSEKSGFNDVKYFGRLFKQRYHETPGCYKKHPTQTIAF